MEARVKRARTMHSYGKAAEGETQWQHRSDWRRKANYEDGVIAVYGRAWRDHARRRGAWDRTERSFIIKPFDKYRLGGSRFESARKRARSAAATKAPSAKRRRTYVEPTDKWTLPIPAGGYEAFVLADFEGDSELVVHWINGAARIKKLYFKRQ